MKTKFVALMLGLSSIALNANAQEQGQTTHEDVPVVETIVNEEETEEETNEGTTAGNFTWQIVSGSDSVMINNSGALHAMMEKFMPPLDSMMKVSLIIGIVILLLPILIVALILYFSYRNRKMKYENYARMAEAGQTIPQEVLTQGETANSDRKLFDKGIKDVCLGIGLMILLGIILGDLGIGIGALMICIGGGELLTYYLDQRNLKKRQQEKQE